MNALLSLEGALRRGEVRTQPCTLHPEFQMLVDDPEGGFRLTYAIVDKSHVQAIVQFVRADPVKGVPCLSVGYAVAENARGRGFGTRAVSNAIDDLTVGLARNGKTGFYLEAVVAKANVPSNRLATRVLGEHVREGSDHHSSEPIFQYLKLID